jgi:hypothetical protein
MKQVERRQNDEPGGEGLLDGVSGCELCLRLLTGESVMGQEVGILGMRVSGCVGAEEPVG